MEIIATKSHRSIYPDPISFSIGEKLVLGKRDSEYSGWIWVTTPNGNQGWAPEQAIEHLTPTGGTALESYSARELETVEKEKLTLLRELNGWLWVENGAGQKGWVPMELTNYQN